MNHPMISSHGSMECLAYPKSSVKKNKNLSLWCTVIPEKDRKKPSPSKRAVNYILSIVFLGDTMGYRGFTEAITKHDGWIMMNLVPKTAGSFLTACLSPSCPSRHQTAPPPDGDADISLGSTWLAAPPRRLGTSWSHRGSLWVDGPSVLLGDFNVGPLSIPLKCQAAGWNTSPIFEFPGYWSSQFPNFYLVLSQVRKI